MTFVADLFLGGHDPRNGCEGLAGLDGFEAVRGIRLRLCVHIARHLQLGDRPRQASRLPPLHLGHRVCLRPVHGLDRPADHCIGQYTQLK